jgi:amidase
VAVVDRPPGGDVHPDVVAGVRAAADALADAGYEVVEAMPPRLEETHEVWTRLVVADVHVMFPLLGMVVGEDARRFFELAFELRPPPDLAGLVSAGIDRHAAARLWDAFQLDTPLVLAPVGTHPPFEVGFDLAGHDEVEATIRRLRTTVTVNLVGLPAVAVPVGIADGLPVGVQVIGPRFREDLCLDAAEAIEAAFGVVTPIDPRA